MSFLVYLFIFDFIFDVDMITWICHFIHWQIHPFISEGALYVHKGGLKLHSFINLFLMMAVLVYSFYVLLLKSSCALSCIHDGAGGPTLD